MEVGLQFRKTKWSKFSCKLVNVQMTTYYVYRKALHLKSNEFKQLKLLVKMPQVLNVNR